MEQGNKRQNLTVKCVVWDKREIIVSSSVYPVNVCVCVCVCALKKPLQRFPSHPSPLGSLSSQTSPSHLDHTV